ncbi:MAG: aminotransferase class I/II-fold pyridoxal phosphate-dependent enzyme [archaeon]
MVSEIINLKLGDIKTPLPQKIISKFCKKVFLDVNQYPHNYPKLISILSKKLGVNEDEIILTNGVDEGIELIARCFGQSTLVFTPSYYEFIDAPKRNQLTYKAINCFDGKSFKLKYTDEDLAGKSLVYLCNPNNPFGLLTKNEILDFAQKTKAIVAVDETYNAFDGETVIKTLPNVLVLRSFSKAYSIAGLRIGFIVGKKELIDEIRIKELYASVTSVSVAAAIIVLEEEKYFKKLIENLKKRKDAFEEFMIKKSFKVMHTNTNNIIVQFLSKADADEFFIYLKSNGVIVNQGNGVSTCGLDDAWIRFACGTSEQMKKVKKIIEKW